ncbi:hypothetical protein EKD16_05800 [Streptomonospora litoralis]|uniref:Uncharacterized protein n=1 Tax=Streptomonospora litoralis TaxID=2498135 RepID=A0A4P6PXY8_9ACTN|nr:hypothetical protein EKD16_05800 [Streptomonospora litoralis]
MSGHHRPGRRGPLQARTAADVSFAGRASNRLQGGGLPPAAGRVRRRAGAAARRDSAGGMAATLNEIGTVPPGSPERDLFGYGNGLCGDGWRGNE